MEETPSALGYRMPAEWEKHEATWIGWPHNKTDWPGKFAPIPWVFGEMARTISQGEIVRIIAVPDVQRQANNVLKRIGVDLKMVEFFNYPTNRGWTRDFGPIFVKKTDPKTEVAIVRFRFTAWARYPDWKKDDAVPPKAAKKLGVKLLPAKIGEKDFVLEGGSVDVNGTGTVLTTEECLLDTKVQVRNPGFGKAEVDRALQDHLGVTNVLWLGNGIGGDDTHGHIDDTCRFVKRDTVVLIQESDVNDINYKPLHENRERLEGMRLEDGSKIQVVPLPMPAPLLIDGIRLPASYANFYISNAAVIVPTFNDPNDRKALGILSELITDRPVVGIHAVDLVYGFGTLHCLTQQQPAR
ncbi:MAG: agmatine deiminase family protein [Ignavibacteriales bacterium]|nr:agmatine deiminase family protein [Ignavibacteriales bacterium]